MQPEDEGRPILMGLVALVAVGLVVGVLVSGGALAATQVLGLTNGHDDSGASKRQSLYLPKPSATESATGPLVTLRPGQETPSASASVAPTPEFKISLSAGQTQVGPLEQIDLTGTYPGGEGRILQVQRLEDGAWEDFADVSAAVTNSTFSTYVETAKLGTNQFRVRDTDSNEVSNEVSIEVQ